MFLKNLIWCPEQLLRQVLVHIHYIPDEWKTKAHTNEVVIIYYYCSIKSLPLL